MKIKSAKFIISVADVETLNKVMKSGSFSPSGKGAEQGSADSKRSSVPFMGGLNEVAFVGRSNAGKSSLINALCNNSKLAKISSTPGKTRLINYFFIEFSPTINNQTQTQTGAVYRQAVLVDLPGYGYAKASQREQEGWDNLIGEYLKNNQNLKCVFILLDIRRIPSDKDKEMLKFLYYYQIPVMFAATKCDKLSRAQINTQLTAIAAEMGIAKNNIIPTSAESKSGLIELSGAIEGKLFSN